MRAIGVGLIVFVVLYSGVTVLGNALASKSFDFNWVIPWLNLVAYLAWAIAGYIAAYFAKTSGIVNGAVTGFGASVLVGLFYAFLGRDAGAGFAEDWYIWLVNGVVLGGLGGLVWRIQKKLGKAGVGVNGGIKKFV